MIVMVQTRIQRKSSLLNLLYFQEEMLSAINGIFFEKDSIFPNVFLMSFRVKYDAVLY